MLNDGRMLRVTSCTANTRFLNSRGIGIPKGMHMVLVEVFDILPVVRRRHSWKINGKFRVSKRGDILVRRTRWPAEGRASASITYGFWEDSHRTSPHRTRFGPHDTLIAALFASLTHPNITFVNTSTFASSARFASTCVPQPLCTREAFGHYR